MCDGFAFAIVYSMFISSLECVGLSTKSYKQPFHTVVRAFYGQKVTMSKDRLQGLCHHDFGEFDINC
jgi:hypothetical protein